MSATTNIEWCDSTFNAWRGCQPAGPGCDNCYAAALSKRTGGPAYEPGEPRLRTSAANWLIPRSWNRQAFFGCHRCGWRGTGREAGLPGDGVTIYAYLCHVCKARGGLARTLRRVFCLSLGDWLDNAVPIEWLVDLLDLVRETPNLEWLLLTKRIGMWRTRLEAAHQVAHTTGRLQLAVWVDRWLRGEPPEHVTIGATVVNQPEYDRDIGKVLRTPARRRFLSIEPMLGLIDMRMGGASLPAYSEHKPLPSIDWVITGGESGGKARPLNPQWVRSIRDQCRAARVPFMHKQNGEFASVSEVAGPGRHHTFEDGRTVRRVTKKLAGRLLDGVQHNGFPT